MTRAVHPRGLLVADELSVRRLDLESGTCSRILSSGQWNLALGDRHFKSVITKRDSFHVVLATHHHVLVCDERFLRMPMVSWTLPSGPTDLLDVESLASISLVVRIASGNLSDASCMAYRESTVRSDEVFNPGPYTSLGPPLSHLQCLTNPSGLAIVRGPSTKSDPVLMVQTGQKGALMVQPLNTSTTSTIDRELVDSGRETSPLVTSSKRFLDREVAEAIECALGRQNDLHEAPQDSSHGELFFAYLPRTLAEVHDQEQPSQPAPTPNSEKKSFPVARLDISDDECLKQHGTILVAENAEENLRQAWIPHRDATEHHKLSATISKFWPD
mmetsp:Transcript_33553/g.132347  ORF Transcript_33553/g.132347 Transcript_33553/m.132347 type:complete len:330 (+) Transcript_33553:1663-2652(+)